MFFVRPSETIIGQKLQKKKKTEIRRDKLSVTRGCTEVSVKVSVSPGVEPGPVAPGPPSHGPSITGPWGAGQGPHQTTVQRVAGVVEGAGPHHLAGPGGPGPGADQMAHH